MQEGLGPSTLEGRGDHYVHIYNSFRGVKLGSSVLMF